MTAQKQAFHLPLQFGQGGIQRFAPRIDDYGPLRAQLLKVKADGLTDTPLDSVTDHGFSQRARHREADTRPWRPRGRRCLMQAESRKKRSRKSRSFVINSPEIL